MTGEKKSRSCRRRAGVVKVTCAAKLLAVCASVTLLGCTHNRARVPAWADLDACRVAASAERPAIAAVVGKCRSGLADTTVLELADKMLRDCAVRFIFVGFEVSAGYSPSERRFDLDVGKLCPEYPLVICGGLRKDRLRLVGNARPRWGPTPLYRRFLPEPPSGPPWFIEVPVGKEVTDLIETLTMPPVGVRVDAESFDSSIVHCLQVDNRGEVTQTIVINPMVTALGEGETGSSWSEKQQAVSDLFWAGWGEVLREYVAP